MRNYSFFFLLLTSIVTGSIYIDYTCIHDIVLRRINANAILQSPMLVKLSFVVVLLFSLFASILVGALFAFHCYLCFTKQTTQEFLKGRKSDGDIDDVSTRRCNKHGRDIQLPIRTKKAVCGLCCEYSYYDTMLKPMWS